jgi:hypothetical protein
MKVLTQSGWGGQSLSCEIPLGDHSIYREKNFRKKMENRFIDTCSSPYSSRLITITDLRMWEICVGNLLEVFYPIYTSLLIFKYANAEPQFYKMSSSILTCNCGDLVINVKFRDMTRGSCFNCDFYLQRKFWTIYKSPKFWLTSRSSFIFSKETKQIKECLK